MRFFGLIDGQSKSLAEIGLALNVWRERAQSQVSLALQGPGMIHPPEMSALPIKISKQTSAINFFNRGLTKSVKGDLN
jgi:hypothetical protein